MLYADINTTQFEASSTATSYIPHQEQNYTITLPTGMELCKIGDYKDYIYKSGDNWYKHKEIGKIVLDGTENWQTASSTSGTENWSYRYAVLLNIIGNSSSSNSLCNRYKVVVISNSNTTQGIYYNKSAGQICIRYGEEDTVENYKTWLYNNNVIFYYVLATPVEELITDTTLINQLNQIEKAKTYQGVTHITQTNADLPFILTLDYKKSNLLRIQALENA